MVNLRIANPLTGLLILIAGGLVLLLFLEIVFLDFEPDAGENSPGYEQIEALSSLSLDRFPMSDDYQPTINRSLFNWDRRPRNIESGPAPEGELSDRWELTGVVNTENEAYAIFNSSADDNRLRLRQGMYLEKWRIDSISVEGVLFSSDGETLVIRLKEAEPPPPDSKSKGKKSSGENRQQENSKKNP